ncbi:MAG: HAMP domain-containing histidine kinase, partial [Sulfurimonas sp.]|nr:HAMP domain-containing histidine kinase [Sulfurimonas sp.]
NIPIFYFFNELFAYLLIVIDILYLIMYFIIKNHLFKYNTSANIIIGIFFVHMLSIPSMNGNDTFVMNWIILYPIVVFGLKNHKESLVHSGVFLIIFYLMFFTSLLHESYTMLDVVMVGMMYLVLTILLYMIIKNMELKENELQELNSTLETRISEAVSDINEKEKLIQQQKQFAQIGEMISMIAHQWRQPLNIITLNTAKLETTILLSDDIDKEDIVQISESINKQSQYLSQTIDDFRNFFKQGKDRNRFVVADMIQNTLKLSDRLFNDNNITVEKNIKTSKDIFSFESELMQALVNIVKNAADALIELKVANPKVVITLVEENENIIISVSDNAGGISEAVSSNIFDPYFSTKSINGTGLGLYMSKIIVEEHCMGELSFANIEGGACFTIKLPFSIAS